MWAKPINSVGSFAIALLQLPDPWDRVHIHLTCTEIGLTDPRGYTLHDGITGMFVMDVIPQKELTVIIKPNSVEVVNAVLKPLCSS